MRATLARLDENPILQGTIGTTPWHMWIDLVETAAVRLGLDPDAVGSANVKHALFRAYHAGEPAWMAVSTAEQLCRAAER